MALDLGTLWAIIAAIVLSMVLGMLWYGPLFGNLWLQAIGKGNISEEEKKAMQAGAMPGYVASMGGAAVAVVLLDFLVTWSYAGGPYASGPRWLHGLVIGFSGWAAFHLVPTFTSEFFEGRGWTLWGLGVAYWGILAMGWGVLVGLLA